MGPPGVGTLGLAAYANVPTRPTNSSKALSERFMDFLLRVWRTLVLGDRVFVGALYTASNILIH